MGKQEDFLSGVDKVHILQKLDELGVLVEVDGQLQS
jgi:hypothetical protein